jgi:hypothetical protein
MHIGCLFHIFLASLTFFSISFAARWGTAHIERLHEWGSKPRRSQVRGLLDWCKCYHRSTSFDKSALASFLKDNALYQMVLKNTATVGDKHLVPESKPITGLILSCPWVVDFRGGASSISCLSNCTILTRRLHLKIIKPLKSRRGNQCRRSIKTL